MTRQYLIDHYTERLKNARTIKEIQFIEQTLNGLYANNTNSTVPYILNYRAISTR